jgi:tRNA(fMet)-specific endonuclease VapC
MHLLDTDTLTHLYAGQLNVIERLRSVEDQSRNEITTFATD